MASCKKCQGTDLKNVCFLANTDLATDAVDHTFLDQAVDGKEVVPKVGQSVTLILFAFFVQQLVLGQIGNVHLCSSMPADQTLKSFECGLELRRGKSVLQAGVIQPYFRFAMVTISSLGTISCCSSIKTFCDEHRQRYATSKQSLSYVSLPELNRS